MSSLNKVQLIGNLGADPDTRYTGNGSAVTQLRIATTERWTDKQSGERQEKTEWHSITAWNKLAEIAGEYLKKGSKVYVEGKLTTDKYTDKDGIERYSTKVIMTQLIMLDGKPEGGNGGGQRQQSNGGQRGYGQGGPQRNDPRGGRDDGGFYRDGGGGQQRAAPTQRSAPPANEGFDDDDIPF